MKELSKKRQQRFDKRARASMLNVLHDEFKKVSKWNRRANHRENFIELDEPLRRGFKRNLIFKASAHRRPDIDVMLEILAFIDVEHHSNTRKFKTTHYYPNRPKKHVFAHESKTLNERECAKLAEKHKPYFDRRRHINRWNGSEYFTYNFIYEDYLESKLSKWFVTKVPVLDPDADSRYAELHNKMWGPEQLFRAHFRARSRWSDHYDDYAYTKEELQERATWKEALVEAAEYNLNAD